MKKKLLQHGLAIFIFLAISFIYFYPTLQGYGLKMADISNWKGMAKEIQDYKTLYGENPLWTNSMFGGMPAFQIATDHTYNVINYIYLAFLLLPSAVKFLFVYALGFYILLCTLKVDFRVAVVGALAYALSSYFIIIIGAGHTSKAMAIGFIAPVVAGFILTYRGQIWRGLALAGLAMALELRANHVQITYYLGFILLAYGITEFIRAYQNKTLPVFIRRSVALILVLGLAILTSTSNLHNTYVYGKQSTRGPSQLTVRADGTSNQDLKTSGLDRDYITAWSYGKQESLTFIIPNAKGGATGQIGNDPAIMKGISRQDQSMVAQNNHYWGDQSFTSGPVYLGIIVFYLFILGLFTLKSRFRWTMLALFFFALFLSWGKNMMWFTNIFLDYLPGYNKFRAVTIILVIVEFVVPLLGFIYLNQVYQSNALFDERFKLGKKDIGLKFYVVSALFALVLIFLYLFPNLLLTFFSEQEMDYFSQALSGNNADRVSASIEALKTARLNIFKSDVLRSLAFLIGAFVILTLYKVKTINRSLVIPLLGLLIVLDLWTVDKRYLNNEKSRGKYVGWEKTKTAEFAHQPTKAYLDILNRELSFNIEKPGLEKLAASAIEEETEALRAQGIKSKLSVRQINDIKFRTLNLNSDFRVLNIGLSTFNDASTSYFFKSIGGYHGAKLKIYQELIEFELQGEIQELINRLKNGVKPHLAFDDMSALNMLNTQYLVYSPEASPIENPNALGNAWFVETINWVDSPDEAIMSLRDFEPKKTAIIDQEYSTIIGDDRFLTSEQNQITQTDYKPNRLTYQANAVNQQLAVFSEIWYPEGWMANIDNKPAPIIRVNYVLRGLVIPPGEHAIEFVFKPQGFQVANITSLISGLLLVLFVFYAVFQEYRNCKLQSKA